MRCFVAFELPESVHEDLHALARRLPAAADVRWVRVGQFHVTAKFLGEIEPAAADRWAGFVRGLAFPAIQVRLQGLGCFPPRGAPRVLWAGLAGDTTAMANLVRELDEFGEHLGVRPEARGFTPHVTIGRVRSPRATRLLGVELERLAPTVVGEPFRVPALVLFRSELRSDGSQYTQLARTPAGVTG
jgi:2'-5' RNA ligase